MSRRRAGPPHPPSAPPPPLRGGEGGGLPDWSGVRVRAAESGVGLSVVLLSEVNANRDSLLLRPRGAGEKVLKADEGVLVVLIFVCALLLASCRSTRPTGSPVTPLSAVTVEDTAAQLKERRATFSGMKSLMQVRATSNGKTQSFRAQLIVHDAQRMELIAYTPVGTTALTMKANGYRVETEPAVPPESFNFLHSAGLTPAETGMLMLGIPPRDDLSVIVGVGGISEATAGGMTASFDPPAFPAKRVVITRGADRIEIDHLEVVSP